MLYYLKIERQYWRKTMRTTVTIDDNTAKKLMRLAGKKTVAQAIKEAIQNYIKMKEKQKLLSLFGKIDLDIDLSELRNRELKEYDSN
jgi:Arc/MetJ family transcription regulator